MQPNNDNQKLIRIAVPVFVFLFFLCSIIFISSRRNTNTTKPTDGPKTEIKFSTKNLPEIETGHYTLWGVNEKSEKIIIKRFNFSEGQLVSLNYSKLESLTLDGSFDFKSYEISVEENGDRDEIQNKCILFKGENKDGKVEFTSAINFAQITGQFSLATPTDGTDSTNESSGLWFTPSLKGENSIPGLKLPDLGECWSYGAYLKYRENYLRMGQFSKPNENDDFQDFSMDSQFGTQLKPKVPGEDFLRNLPFNIPAPINAANNSNEIIISIEPKYSEMRLFLNHEPFINLLSYKFNGTEKSRTTLNMSTNAFPSFEITVSTTK